MHRLWLWSMGIGLLVLALVGALAWGDSSWTSSQMATDPTSCPDNATKGPLNSTCLDLDSGAGWACVYPARGGDPGFCDSPQDWIAVAPSPPPVPAVTILAKSAVDVTVGNMVTEIPLFTVMVPGGTLKVDSCVRVTIQGNLLNNTGASQNMLLRVKYGTVATAPATLAIPTGAPSRSVEIRGHVCGNGVPTSQRLWYTGVVHGVTIVGASAGPALDSATPFPLDVTIQLGLAAPTLTFTKEYAVAEVLP